MLKTLQPGIDMQNVLQVHILGTYNRTCKKKCVQNALASKAVKSHHTPISILLDYQTKASIFIISFIILPMVTQIDLYHCSVLHFILATTLRGR